MNTPSVLLDAAVDAEHPWLGLASFTEQTRQYFFGREGEIGELTRRVQRKQLTVLFGQSGLGKTSILNAGVVPRLRAEGYCPVYVRVDYGSSAPPPAEQIKQAVFRATAGSGAWTRPGSAERGESLWEFLHHRDDELRDAEGRSVIPLLIFDQFEEIFTLAQADDAGRARATEFIADLADLVENRPPRALEARMEADDGVAERFDFARADYRILIALREDYLAHLEGLKSAMPSITQNRMRLARMTGEQALDAVLKPGGSLVTAEVAESIVRFVAGGAELRNAEVEPSLLSLICRELNNARIAQGKTTISIDVLAGSNATILGEFYERALADQPAALRKVIEDALLTDSGYRENIAEERVLKAFAAAAAQPDAATALATLVNRRLLRIEERLDVRRVELTHDVLCSVVKASRAERLEREAREEAERKLAAQREHERATRAALVRARKIAAGCAALAVVAIASAVYGIYSANRAIRAEEVSQLSRDEAERLVEFILDDFYAEMEPIGRADVMAALAKRAVEYYNGLPPEARNASTRRNSAIARAQYSQVLRASGRTPEADVYLDSASAMIDAEVRNGDRSDATVIAAARIALLKVQRFSTRADHASAVALGLRVMQDLKPVLSRVKVSAPVRMLESDILYSLGFAQLRSYDSPAAVESLRRALAITRSLGSAELGNLAATADHIRISWVLAESIGNTSGSMAERRALLTEGVTLADRLLAVRPGYRPTLRAKSSALGGLADLESDSLQARKSLRYHAAASEVDRDALRLDTGLGVSQNNLRVRHVLSGWQYLNLGEVAEGLRYLDRAHAVEKGEYLDAFSASNLAAFVAFAAVFHAEIGEIATARSFLKEADGYSRLALSRGASESSEAITKAIIATQLGIVAEISGQRSEWIAARRAVDGIWEDQRAGRLVDSAFGSSSLIALALTTGARLSLLLDDPGAAEVYARGASEFTEKLRIPDSASARWERASISYPLVIALARQGKKAEAMSLIQPALAFFREPVARESDHQTLKGSHAEALYAAALASTDSARRRAYILEAAQRFDSMPEALRVLRSYAELRAAISRELSNPRLAAR